MLSSHLGAVVSLWLAALPVMPLLAATFIVILHLHQVWRRHVGLTADAAVRQLVWEDGDSWHLHYASGETRRKDLLTPYYVTSWMVVLRFKGDTVVLLPDSLNHDGWRQLRVRLLLTRQ